MDSQISSDSAHIAQVTTVFALVIAFLTFLPKLSLQFKLSKLPLFGLATNNDKQRAYFLKYCKDLYRKGYKQFTKSVYRMAADDDMQFVVIPPKFLPELNKIPDDVVDLPGAVNKMFEGHYTKHETNYPILVHSIKADLTPSLKRLSEHITNEIDNSMQRFLPACEDWTKLVIYENVTNIIAQASGRLFVGPEYCRDPEYVDIAVNFTNETTTAAFAVKSCSRWLRPFKATRLPEVQQLQDRFKRATKFFEPIINQRQDPNNKSDDMLQWMMDRCKSSMDLPSLIRQQLTLTVASIHTTAMTTTNSLFSLAAMPEYIKPLREEIQTVLEDNNGSLTPRALQQLVKLDSFIKEVGRWYPFSITSFARYVHKPFVLSNGQHIPAGVMIEVPSDAVSFDSTLFTNPDEFDGFRYYKMRENSSTGELARSQFVSANERDMLFGYGKHACPGRFFAANEIKTVLARMIMDYDIVMPDGRKERYEPIQVDRQVVPNPSNSLLLKRRKI
ncbi:cytochrome P450 monooxygenase-like protein [Bipolaris maydis]|nr:cytochrome P450 monooxygenase-like protein [Bipolaris maydis]KAJ6199521.1 cytochrome P450 monooxygenase-like protein [Bipolaris maydis]KAJ6205881.1 cytochrome P450 monooxygenase-like protein [Bipolaris maydis]